MRRSKLISRLRTLLLATLGCLVLAVLAPGLFTSGAPDEPYVGYAVMASARQRLPKIRACIDYWAEWVGQVSGHEPGPSGPWAG